MYAQIWANKRTDLQTQLDTQKHITLLHVKNKPSENLLDSSNKFPSLLKKFFQARRKMIYNTRIKHYAKGQQVTIYNKTFRQNDETEQKNKNFNKSYQNENRNEQQVKDCQRISIKQTKNRIYDIARANEWEWFITLTFDRKKKDSSDYDEVTKSLQNFLENIRKRQCPNIKYLIVPELHADGKHYHFHGLLANCNNLCFTYSGHCDKKSNKPIYNIAKWTCGFSTATQIEDSSRASSYITKYITKECCIILKNKKRYYASHNVNKPIEEYVIVDFDEFINERGSQISYCKTIDVPHAHMQIKYFEFDKNDCYDKRKDNSEQTEISANPEQSLR